MTRHTRRCDSRLIDLFLVDIQVDKRYIFIHILFEYYISEGVRENVKYEEKCKMEKTIGSYTAGGSGG